jgi:hypothetical protein
VANAPKPPSGAFNPLRKSRGSETRENWLSSLWLRSVAPLGVEDDKKNSSEPSAFSSWSSVARFALVLCRISSVAESSGSSSDSLAGASKLRSAEGRSKTFLGVQLRHSLLQSRAVRPKGWE